MPPPAVDPSRIQVGVMIEGQVRISGQVGSAEPGASVVITNARTAQTFTMRAESDGSFTLLVAAQYNDHLQIMTFDEAGNAGASSRVDVKSPLPADPSAVAPPLDRTIVTDFASATAFLYSGSGAIQTGITPEAIQARRVAVLRGQVLTAHGSPLAGVAISILSHPEYGQTMTRADGLFDMAVNGGGLLTVRYEKERPAGAASGAGALA